jgi:hypothetical protein
MFEKFESMSLLWWRQFFYFYEKPLLPILKNKLEGFSVPIFKFHT